VVLEVEEAGVRELMEAVEAVEAAEAVVNKNLATL